MQKKEIGGRSGCDRDTIHPNSWRCTIKHVHTAKIQNSLNQFVEATDGLQTGMEEEDITLRHRITKEGEVIQTLTELWTELLTQVVSRRWCMCSNSITCEGRSVEQLILGQSHQTFCLKQFLKIIFDCRLSTSVLQFICSFYVPVTTESKVTVLSSFTYIGAWSC